MHQVRRVSPLAARASQLCSMLGMCVCVYSKQIEHIAFGIGHNLKINAFVYDLMNESVLHVRTDKWSLKCNGATLKQREQNQPALSPLADGVVYEFIILCININCSRVLYLCKKKIVAHSTSANRCH